MYFVDRNNIEQTLRFFETQLALFDSTPAWQSEIEKRALERISHLMIECILDVGNDMIDGFIMRDPGSYDDIMDILTDEKVVAEDEANKLAVLDLFQKAACSGISASRSSGAVYADHVKQGRAESLSGPCKNLPGNRIRACFRI